jgi:Cadherin-like domain
VTVAEDSGANAIPVLANDSDVDGDTPTITGVTQGANGAVAITGGGTGITYTPNANFFGPDSFTYTISDGNGGSDTATVNVTVANINDTPIANPDFFTIDKNTILNFGTNLQALSANDIDVDGDPLSVAVPADPVTGLLGSPVNGVFGLRNDNRTYFFDPDFNFVGIASFTYRIIDPSGLFTVGTVRINVVEPELDI